MLLLPVILWWAKSPMRFSLGRSKNVVCMLSLWAFLLAATPMAPTVMAAQPVSDPTVSPDQVIREGTIIPPTEGEVVMLGRRWAFIPRRKIAANDAATTAVSEPSPESNLRRFSKRQESQDGEIRRMTGPITLMLSENLMLQRIVESVRSDGADNRWILSGKVTEFFGENRMEIRTAQRSNEE